MNHIIRQMKESEYPLLEDFLYNAIFIPEGCEPPQRSIVLKPELKLYTENFGQSRSDLCLCAEVNGAIHGAVWTRIMDDYGHVDDKTPSLAISLHRGYRSAGIGTSLLRAMLKLLSQEGYDAVSLSVQKENYAYRMYISAGFRVIGENSEEYIMLCTLR